MKNKLRFLIVLLSVTSFGFAQEQVQKHIVSKGETVTQIAKKYRTTVNEIFTLNSSAVNGISESEVLIIPNSTTGSLTHEVLPQETVYGISKKYNIAIDQLYLFNPGLKEQGLKVGQLIFISKPKKAQHFSTNTSYIQIEVKEKETLYSIAQLNNTTVQAIYELNPGLEQQGLKKGQTIKIPSTKNSAPSNLTNATPSFVIVEPKETLYGISKKFNVSQEDLLTWNPTLKEGLKEGMKIFVQQPVSDVSVSLPPVSQVQKNEKVTKNANEVQELTFLLPFNIQEDTFSNRANLNKRLNTDVFLNMTLDFYSGALMAIDSAKAMNLPILIKIVDSKENNRSLDVEALKNEIDFSSTDVVIGPFFQKNVDAFSEIFKNDDLLIVSPLSTDAGKPYSNQVHAMPNSDMIRSTMMEYLRSKNGNIITVLNPKTISSKQFFKSDFPEVKLIDAAENGAVNKALLEANIIAGKTNYVILDSNSLKTSIDLVMMLKKLKTKYDVRLVVLEKNEVLDSTEINMKDLVDLKFTFPSVTNESTNQPITQFEKDYLKRFNAKPNRFAIRGFDVTMDVISRMMQNDEDSNNVFGYGSEQIENKFIYVNENGGIFNSGIYILYYDKDLTIKEAE